MFPIFTDTVVDLQGPAPADGEALVTVAVSLFDYGPLVAECLDSVAAQRHSAIELVVVDDASTDDGADRAAAWLHAHPERFVRARLLRHRRNQGLSQARNTAFAAAAGSWVMVLDADNALYPRCVGRLLETAQDTGAAAVYPQLELFGDHRGLGYADVWDPELFRAANYVDAMALVRRDAWARVGGYAHLDIGWEDYDLWLRFIEAGLEGVFVPELLARYRVHAASMLRSDVDAKTGRIAQRMASLHPWLRLVAD